MIARPFVQAQFLCHLQRRSRIDSERATGQREAILKTRRGQNGFDATKGLLGDIEPIPFGPREVGKQGVEAKGWATGKGARLQRERACDGRGRMGGGGSASRRAGAGSPCRFPIWVCGRESSIFPIFSDEQTIGSVLIFYYFFLQRHGDEIGMQAEMRQGQRGTGQHLD